MLHETAWSSPVQRESNFSSERSSYVQDVQFILWITLWIFLTVLPEASLKPFLGTTLKLPWKRFLGCIPGKLSLELLARPHDFFPPLDAAVKAGFILSMKTSLVLPPLLSLLRSARRACRLSGR